MISRTPTDKINYSNSRYGAIQAPSKVAESLLKVATSISLIAYPMLPAMLMLSKPLQATCIATCSICERPLQSESDYAIQDDAITTERDHVDGQDNISVETDNSTRYEIIFLMLIMGGLKYLSWSGFAEIIRQREALAVGMAFFCGNQPISEMDKIDTPNQTHVMQLHGLLFTWFFCLAGHNIACHASNKKGMFLMQPVKAVFKYLNNNCRISSEQQRSDETAAT